MILAANIARRAWALIQDEDGVRWEEPEVLDWINDAAAAIVNVRPMAGAKTETLTLDEGALQRVANAVEVMDVVRNVGGRAIQRTNRYQLETSAPDWYAMAPSERIIHWTFDDRKRTQFYVYPPAAAGHQVEALIARVPARVEAMNQEVDIGEDYINAMVDFVCYRALTKDSEFGDGRLSMAFYQAFQAALGLKNEVSMAVSPNAQRGDA